jgi:hypothetical protein
MRRVFDIQPIYYVYAYIDPGTGDPFYIGKGHGNRDTMHLRPGVIKRRGCRFFYNRLSKTQRYGITPTIKRLISDVDEYLAFVYERFFILATGRRCDPDNLGPLCNLTNGGDGVGGLIMSEVDKAKRAISSTLAWQDTSLLAAQSARSKTMWLNTEYRTQLKSILDAVQAEPSYRLVLSAAGKRNWRDPQYRDKVINALRSVWATPAFRAKMSDAFKNTWASDGYREKMSAIRSETAAKPEYRAKMSAALKAVWQDDVQREQRCESNRQAWDDPERRAQAALTTKERLDTDADFRQHFTSTSRRMPPKGDGFKGVHFFAATGGYRVQIQCDGRRYRLGSHNTAEIAARVYDGAARYVHGGDCYVNLPLAEEWWEV